MKKKTVGILLASAIFSIGGLTALASCSNPNNGGDKVEQVVTSIEFEQKLYEVNTGDKVVVKGEIKGVKYRLKDAIEGISLDENTGVFTFDEKRLNYPDGILIATYKDLDPVTTIVKFLTNPDLPTVKINNISNYLVNGESVNGTSVLESQEVLAVEYKLKNEVEGISIDLESGKVTYLESVLDGTKFTVIATSRGISVEREFIALIDNIVFADTTKFVVENGRANDASFKINYNGNTGGDSETNASNAAVMFKGTSLDKKFFTYNQETKTVTIKKEFVANLEVGENVLSFVTKRNNVPLNLVVATQVIYEAKQLVEIFGLDYTPYIADITKAPNFNKEALNGYYVLGDDLDLNSLYKVNKDLTRYGFLPIGYAAEGDNGPLFSIPFTGTFDGNGHTISNFTFNHNDQHFWASGMFGFNTGTIKNFTLKGTVKEIRGWTGIICGKNNGTIENIIVDVNIPVAVETSYSALVSVNNGTIRNVISLNDKVEAQVTKNNGGYIVGWNGTGHVDNVYAVKSKVADREITDDNGSPIGVGAPLKLYGRDDHADQSTYGIVFEDLAALKAYNFKDVLPTQFEIQKDGMPTLKVEHTFNDLAKFNVKINKAFALKGQTIDIETTILPLNLRDELLPKVKYEIPENKGIVIANEKVDLTNLNVSNEGEEITIKASLTHEGETMTSTFKFTAYMAITEFRFVSLPATILTGVNYDLNITSKQMDDIKNVEYTITTKDAFTANWQRNYFVRHYAYLNSKERTLTLDDYVAFINDAKTLTITAKSGNLKVSKDVTVSKVNALPGHNSDLKYSGETTNFELPVNGLTINEVLIDSVKLEASKYNIASGKLEINRDVISDTNINHEVLLKTSDNNYLKAYIGASDKIRHDDSWIKANDANLIHIKTTDDFVKYFITEGFANKANSFVLDNDLDFTGVKGLKSPYNDENYFTGKIYCNGHTIKNYEIVKNDNAWGGTAIFNAFDGEIYDLFLENVNATLTAGNRLGTLVGTAQAGAHTLVYNVHARDCHLYLGDSQPHFHAGVQKFGRIVAVYCGADMEKVLSMVNFTTFDGFTSHVVDK